MFRETALLLCTLAVLLAAGAHGAVSDCSKRLPGCEACEEMTMEEWQAARQHWIAAKTSLGTSINGKGRQLAEGTPSMGDHHHRHHVQTGNSTRSGDSTPHGDSALDNNSTQHGNGAHHGNSTHHSNGTHHGNATAQESSGTGSHGDIKAPHAEPKGHHAHHTGNATRLATKYGAHTPIKCSKCQAPEYELKDGRCGECKGRVLLPSVGFLCLHAAGSVWYMTMWCCLLQACVQLRWLGLSAGQAHVHVHVGMQGVA